MHARLHAVFDVIFASLAKCYLFRVSHVDSYVLCTACAHLVDAGVSGKNIPSRTCPRWSK